MTGARLNIALAIASILAILAACLAGPVSIPLGSAFRALIGLGSAGDAIILQEIRLPRAIAAWATGIALGASGAALQGMLRNPLAEPGVLGVSAAAALGATLTLVAGITLPLALPFAAIAGALAATTMLAAVGARTHSLSTIVLVGVGLSSLCGSAMALAMNLSSNPFTLADLVNWMLGSVANRSFADLMPVALPLAAGLALIFAARHGLSALALGEEAARGIGADTRRIKLAIILGTGLATGASVAIAGVIGFVGIVAPHIVRPFVGHDPGRTMLPAALLSGVLLVLADLAVRLLPGDTELKLGVAVALAGAPAFILIAWRRGGGDD